MSDYFADESVQLLIKTKIDMGENEEGVKAKLAEQMGDKYMPKNDGSELF